MRDVESSLSSSLMTKSSARAKELPAKTKSSARANELPARTKASQTPRGVCHVSLFGDATERKHDLAKLRHANMAVLPNAIMALLLKHNLTTLPNTIMAVLKSARIAIALANTIMAVIPNAITAVLPKHLISRRYHTRT